MNFDINNTKRWISFCSNYTQVAATFNISLQLGGDNSASYNLPVNSIQVIIASAASLNATPTQTITVIDAQKTYAHFRVTTNVPGFFFYHANLAPFSTPLSLSNIQTLVKSNNPVVESNSDYLNKQIYNLDRDNRVGFSPMANIGNNFVNL